MGNVDDQVLIKYGCCLKTKFMDELMPQSVEAAALAHVLYQNTPLSSLWVWEIHVVAIRYPLAISKVEWD